MGEEEEVEVKKNIYIFTPGNVITSTTIIGGRWPWRVIVWVAVEGCDDVASCRASSVHNRGGSEQGDCDNSRGGQAKG